MVRPRPAHDSGVATQIAMLVVVSIVAGVLAAGLALPVVGAAGAAAKNTAESFNNLPSELQTPPLPQTSTILAANGSVIARIYSENRIVVPLQAIAPVLQRAVVAIEDSRFYEHGGVDIHGALRALAANLQSGSVQEGASTLTMQYVRNVLVVTAQTDAERAAARAVTTARKLREMRLAIGLEQRWTKQQILEGYLNIAYFGAGAYGAEAASRRYFSKSAKDLTLPEAAMLAGIVQQPVAFDPLLNPAASQQRRDVVLDRMLQLGDITQAQHDQAVAVPVKAMLKPRDVPNGCTTSAAPFFCDYVMHQLLNDPTFGKTAEDRKALIDQGGLVIRTTLDVKAQSAAQASVEKYIPYNDPSGKAAALAMVEPGTGSIKAMAENRRWGVSGLGYTTYNYAVDAADGGTVGMQAGSTFKAFTLAAALQQGIPINEPIAAPQTRTFTGFTNCSGQKFAPYTLSNSTGAGTFNMRTGTALSINTFFVELERRTGICQPVQIAEALGVHTGSGKPPSQVPSFTLGVDDVTPLTMASAYATFAAQGKYCAPRAITSVADRNGKQLPVPPVRCSQALDPAIANGVASILAGVIDGPIRGRTGASMSLGRPAGGKTGTTDSNAAVWFVGFVPQLSTAVWAGDPRGGFGHPMQNVTINGHYYVQVYGLSIPGPIWRETMKAALQGVPVQQFPALDPTVIRGITVQVPDLAGLTPAQAAGKLTQLGLSSTVVPTPVDSTYPAGTIDHTDPAAGASLSPGATVTLYLSSGTPPAPSPSPTVSASPSASSSPSASPTVSPAVLPSPKPKPSKH
jgi:membrane peptidoglycan carboxypeptidase